MALKWLLQAPEACLGRGCRPASPSAPRVSPSPAPRSRGPGGGGRRVPLLRVGPRPAGSGCSRANGAAVAPGVPPRCSVFYPRSRAALLPPGPGPAVPRSRCPGRGQAAEASSRPREEGPRVLLCEVRGLSRLGSCLGPGPLRPLGRPDRRY